jgi:CubicO group peptidase (beta-lactamase class C family)
MKIKNLLSIAITIFLLFTSKQSVKAQTGVYSPSLVNFDVAMTNLLNDFDIPGGQLAITYQGRLVYSRGFGFADESTSTAVCPNSIFRMASLSKQITAITIMHLYEQGRVGLNDLVFGPNGILPEPIYQTILDTRVYNIKVKHLLSHQGGWDRDISGDPEHNSYAIALAMSVPPPANNETIIQYTLSQQMLDFTPGSSAAYSNLGFNILGEVIEKKTSQDYETYVRDTILAPLGITDMHSAKSLLVNKYPNEVNYYDYPGAPLVPSVFNNNILGPMQYGGSKCHMEVRAAGGGWVASAQDLCKLLCAVDLYPTKPDILLPATINTMVQPVHSYLGSPYALGWYINTTDNNWFHTGLLHGTMTFQCRRNDGINYALLVNSRPNLYSAQYTALNDLVRSIVPLITSWPTFDLFDSTVVCSPLSSVNNISQNQSLFTVYPNPAKSQITIKVDALLLGSNYIIYDFTGKSVLSGKIISEDSHIELGNLSGGIYLLSVGENMNQTFKVIKE